MFRVALVSLFILTACTPTQPQENMVKSETDWGDALGSEIKSPFNESKHRVFDFWIGEWNMEWRAKNEDTFYHNDSGEWTYQRVFPVLDGKALVELAWAREGFDVPSQRGFSLRYFDEGKGRWVMAQNWPNEKRTGTAFADQLIGKSNHGRHSFYSIVQRPKPDGAVETEHRRYNFADIMPDKSFRWDGSNTKDLGKSWYSWAVVDAHKIEPLKPFGAAGEPLPGVHNETLCKTAPHSKFDDIEGTWTGTVEGDDFPRKTDASMFAGKVLDGCGMLAVVSYENKKVLLTIGYLEPFESWVLMKLDNQPGTTHQYYVNKGTQTDASFESAPKLKIMDEFTPYLNNAAFDDTSDSLKVELMQVSDTVLRLTFKSAPHDSDPLGREVTFDFKRN